MFMKKGQIEIPILVIIVFGAILFILIGKILSYVTFTTVKAYSEELNELDIDLSTLLNYNNCPNSDLPVKELIGLYLVSGSSNDGSFTLDYGGTSKSVDVKSCIRDDVLDKFSEINSKNYLFFVKFDNKNYLTVEKGDIKEDKLNVHKRIPVPKEYSYAEIHLITEKR